MRKAIGLLSLFLLFWSGVAVFGLAVNTLSPHPPPEPRRMSIWYRQHGDLSPFLLCEPGNCWMPRLARWRWH
jgi:hypothetical protein